MGYRYAHHVRQMTDKRNTTQSETSCNDMLSLRIPDELSAKITRSAVTSKMPRSAMLRLAIDRGLDRLLEQLEAKQEGAQ